MDPRMFEDKLNGRFDSNSSYVSSSFSAKNKLNETLSVKFGISFNPSNSQSPKTIGGNTISCGYRSPYGLGHP
jgi:hypothetical protein